MITFAVQKGSTIFVYGERNNTLFVKSGTLQGFTGSTVAVKQGSRIYVYDEKGNQISSYSA